MYTPVSMYFPLDVYPKMSQWKNCTHTELSKLKKKEEKARLQDICKLTDFGHLIFFQREGAPFPRPL